MIRNIAIKATVEQTHSVGAWLFQQGHTPDEIMAWFKSRNYIVKGTKFNAAYVANFVAGARFASALVATPKPKAKRVAKPKASKPVTPVADDEEVPF